MEPVADPMLESGNDSRNVLVYVCMCIFFQAPTIFTNITSVCVQPYDFVSVWIGSYWSDGFLTLVLSSSCPVSDRFGYWVLQSLAPRSLKLGEWGLQSWGLTWMEPALVSDVILSDSIVSELTASHASILSTPANQLRRGPHFTDQELAAQRTVAQKMPSSKASVTSDSRTLT